MPINRQILNYKPRYFENMRHFGTTSTLDDNNHKHQVTYTFTSGPAPWPFCPGDNQRHTFYRLTHPASGMAFRCFLRFCDRGLVIFTFWKHIINRLPLTYDPIWWSLVFLLGMYSVASARLGLAAEFQPLQWIAELALWFALGAWVRVLFGLFKQLWPLTTDSAKSAIL